MFSGVIILFQDDDLFRQHWAVYFLCFFKPGVLNLVCLICRKVVCSSLKDITQGGIHEGGRM